MKTTLELPDELLIAAKKKAAEMRRPLRSLVEEGLRAVLKTQAGRAKARPKDIRWITAKGGLPPGIDVSDRAAMHEWLRKGR